MTRKEFLSYLPEGAKEPTEREWEKIVYLHDYHPSFGSEEGIEKLAKLYTAFGMSFCNLLDAASDAKHIREKRIDHVEALESLDKSEKELADKCTGCCKGCKDKEPKPEEEKKLHEIRVVLKNGKDLGFTCRTFQIREGSGFNGEISGVYIIIADGIESGSGDVPIIIAKDEFVAVYYNS